MQSKGELTDRIVKKSKNLLGYEISASELRLMPYISQLVQNNHRIIWDRIDKKDERDVVADWLKRGYITGGADVLRDNILISTGTPLKVSQKFWNAMSEIIYLGYVDVRI